VSISLYIFLRQSIGIGIIQTYHTTSPASEELSFYRYFTVFEKNAVKFE